MAKTQAKRKVFNFRGSLSIPYIAFMFIFVLLPLLLIVVYAFTDKNGHFNWFTNWKDVLSNIDNWIIIKNTLIISFLTTLFCILIAYPIAMILSNKKFNKNKVLVYAFIMPMWINFVIRTFALKALLNTTSFSLFGQYLTGSHPYIAIVIGMVYDYLPFAILPLYNQMLKMDKNQIEAAADLGANPILVFIKVIIPMTIPGIISAATMTFMPTMSSYVISNNMSERSVLIVGSVISQYFDLTEYNLGSVLSLVMLGLIGLSLVAEKLILGKREQKKAGLY